LTRYIYKELVQIVNRELFILQDDMSGSGSGDDEDGTTGGTSTLNV